MSTVTNEHLRIAHFEPVSLVNGPGPHAVLWVQGCTLKCPGCFNPQTHSRYGGHLVPVAKLVSDITALAGQIRGLTLTGGEPLQQLPPIIRLLEELRQAVELGIILFTGFEWDEIVRFPRASRLLQLVDVMITGRFLQNRRMAQGLQGSANKQFHLLTGRYRRESIESTESAEVLIAPNGDIFLSGIDPIDPVELSEA